jgi:hypothetical protein
MSQSSRMINSERRDRNRKSVAIGIRYLYQRAYPTVQHISAQEAAAHCFFGHEKRV